MLLPDFVSSRRRQAPNCFSEAEYYPRFGSVGMLGLAYSPSQAGQVRMRFKWCEYSVGVEYKLVKWTRGFANEARRIFEISAVRYSSLCLIVCSNLIMYVQT